MSTQRWKTSNTVVFNINYHLIWCPKYRRKVLTNNIAIRLQELLIEKAQKINVQIEKIAIMPDHVHLFVKSTSINAPHYIVQQLKGYSSRILRQEFKTLRSRLPTLWTRSYYVETIGHISEKTVKKYIEDQKKH